MADINAKLSTTADALLFTTRNKCGPRQVSISHREFSDRMGQVGTEYMVDSPWPVNGKSVKTKRFDL